MGRHEDHGASAIEYGITLFAIAAVTLIAVFSLGSVSKDLFSRASVCVEAEAGSTC
jgi:Flp pilus assembly pilin Flp